MLISKKSEAYNEDTPYIHNNSPSHGNPLVTKTIKLWKLQLIVWFNPMEK